MDRRTLFAGGGVTAAALVGGWFVFLRNGGGDGSPGAVSPGRSRSDAPTITDGRYGLVTLEDGSSHFFAANLDAGDQLEVTMEFSHTEGDLDIDLLDPSGGLVATAVSVTDNETVSTTASTGGAYYIESYGFFGSTNSYELDVRIN